MRTYDSRYPSISDLEARARRRLPRFAREYLCGGVGQETGLRRNRAALDRVLLQPAFLRDVSDCSTEVTLFGQSYSMPVGIAPVGLAGLIWPGSEMALAGAACRARVPFTLSMAGTSSLEDIAEATEAWAWLQLYPALDFAISSGVLSRAEAAGYRVLVVTVDVPVGAKRDREIRSALSLPLRMTARNIFSAALSPAWTAALLRHGLPGFGTLAPYAPPDMADLGGLAEFISTLMAKGVSLDELQRIREKWRGSLIVKGILRPEDAAMACAAGADGIIVSNHGGRQLDAAPASIEALPGIVREVGDRCSVMLDSGVRDGLDVLRAMASGAACVFSGRSFYFGVAAMGQRGGSQAIEIFRDEVGRGLAQLGCTDINALDQSWLCPQPA